MTLKDIPCIKDQAYFIMVGTEGSWLFEATYPSNQDEKWCKRFVDTYVEENGWDDKAVQEVIDMYYESVVCYRVKKLVNS